MKTKTSELSRFLAFGLVTTLGMSGAYCATQAERGQLSSADFKFVREAAEGGKMEVELGQLAAQKGADPDVRDFGQRMVQDHEKANHQLMQLVSQKGATLPNETAGKEQGTVEHLKGLSGTDFDRAYMEHMVADHKKDVKEFQKEAAKARDSEIKDFAAKTLPILQEHLSIAENVEGKVAGERRQPKTQ
jgi:putative membrane protein